MPFWSSFDLYDWRGITATIVRLGTSVAAIWMSYFFLSFVNLHWVHLGNFIIIGNLLFVAWYHISHHEFSPFSSVFHNKSFAVVNAIIYFGSLQLWEQLGYVLSLLCHFSFFLYFPIGKIFRKLKKFEVIPLLLCYNSFEWLQFSLSCYFLHPKASCTVLYLISMAFYTINNLVLKMFVLHASCAHSINYRKIFPIVFVYKILPSQFSCIHFFNMENCPFLWKQCNILRMWIIFDSNILFIVCFSPNTCIILKVTEFLCRFYIDVSLILLQLCCMTYFDFQWTDRYFLFFVVIIFSYSKKVGQS